MQIPAGGQNLYTNPSLYMCMKTPLSAYHYHFHCPFSIHSYLYTLSLCMPVILRPVNPADEGTIILHNAQKYQMTHHHIPKDLNLQHQHEKLKSWKITFNFIHNNLVQINKIYVCRHRKRLQMYFFITSNWLEYQRFRKPAHKFHEGKYISKDI